MFKIWLCLCLLLPFSAQAQLYKVVDENGKIRFTDVPPSHDAKALSLGRISSVGNPEYNMDKVNMRLHYTEEKGAMIVVGQVNGVAMRFVVDTGATLVTIPPAIAKKAGLSMESNKMVRAETANGTIHVAQTSIKKLTIDQVSQKNVAAVVQTIATNAPDLGLLGMSFFNAYNMTIQHNSHEILLEKK